MQDAGVKHSRGLGGGTGGGLVFRGKNFNIEDYSQKYRVSQKKGGLMFDRP